MKNKPEIIIFDYGNTLVEEDVVFHPSTFKRIYESIVTNPNKHNQDYIYHRFRELERQVADFHHNKNIEFRYEDVFKVLFTKLNLVSNVDYEKLSEYYFDDYAPGRPTPGAKKTLEYLNKNGIRTGVISNLSYSEDILNRRLNRLLGHPFEFVITTGEWIFRKPDPKIFNIGIQMAGVKPEDAWYVGDNPLCDVIGAYNADLVPVYYDTETHNPFLSERDNVEIDVDHILIDRLDEIIDLVKEK